jgi:Zn-dependent M28 family amino/carboxypeptidase
MNQQRPRLALASCLLALTCVSAVAQTPSPAPSLAATYKPAADKLLSASLADPEGYATLAYLCDHIGKRISGSESLTRAIAWAADLMRREGFANVRTQAATVPHWVRGHESGEIIAPVSKPLHMLGLGMSVGTPRAGITAPVVVVPDFAALDKLGRAGVQGRIVVFNAPYIGYGRTVMYRVAGPQKAEALGAVGALVRSITPLAAQLPHTGTTSFGGAPARIPAAAISIEDALMLERLQAEGAPVRVHMQMDAHMEAPILAANVIGEIVGSEHPEQIVAVGGHIDSWDVGQGAQDDGSGIMASLAAAHEIMKAGLHPKRTIRVVFWVNEENGGAGGIAYRKALSPAELANHVAAIEMDGGAEPPVGFGYGASGARRRSAPGDPATPAPATALSEGELHSLALLREIGTLIQPVLTGSEAIKAGGGGSDIGPLMADGVPGLGESTTGAHYFDWHHTEADTLDKVNPEDFRKNVASLAVMTYVLADMPERLTGHQGAGEE